jgi:hypothetical protein
VQAQVAEVDTMNLTNLYGKMAEARSRLGVGLLKCIAMHHQRPSWTIEIERRTSKCPCDGCALRDVIEAAIFELEV